MNLKGMERKPSPSHNRLRDHNVEPALCPATFPGQQREPGEEAREKCEYINF